MRTTGTKLPGPYSGTAQSNGIADWMGHDVYTEADEPALHAELFAELRREIDARLPTGMTWHPETSELVHPVDADLPTDADLTEIFGAAWAAVEARFDAIESRVIPG